MVAAVFLLIEQLITNY